MFVIVTNTGEPFASKFDGRLYEFKPGEDVPITVDAARHIFGFGLADKREVFSRHTWMTKSTEFDQAMERLGKFKFNVGNMKIVAETPQLEIQESESPPLAPDDEGEADNGHGQAPVQTGADGGNKASDGAGTEPPAPTNKQPGMHEEIFT